MNLLNDIWHNMDRETITKIYDTHNIRHEKCELYNDFIQSLVYLIIDTYLGDEITNKEQQQQHFNWCWRKTVELFKIEGMDFENDELHTYFTRFANGIFYTASKPNDSNIKYVLKTCNQSLAYTYNKSKSDIDTMLELYTLFEKSIKKA